MIKCQICGHDNPEGAEYCEDCGTSLSAPAAPPSAGPQPAAGATPPPVDPAATPTPAEVAPAGTFAPEAPDGVSPDLTASEVAAAGTTPAMPEAPPATGEVQPAPSADAVLIPPEAPTGQDAAAPEVATETAPPTPVATSGANPRLVPHRYGATADRELPLLGDRLVVGRFDPETGPVDIDLSEAPEAGQISRHHAEVYREADGGWYVKDLGSTNGVFVKSGGSSTFGPRLTAPRALASGDEVAFGNARFIFRMD